MKFKNKKIKILNACLGVGLACSSLGVIPLSLVTSSTVVETKKTLETKNDTNAGVLPVSYLSFADSAASTILNGFVYQVTSAILSQYDTIEIPSTVQTISSLRNPTSSSFSLNLNCTFASGSKLKEIDGAAFGSTYSENNFIGSFDFSNCSQLKTIGASAFSNIRNLSGSIDLSHTIVDTIPQYCFANDSLINSVLFPQSTLSTISAYAFSNCSLLVSVGWKDSSNKFRFPQSLNIIWGFAFNNCTSLSTLDLTLCSGLTQIGDCAFLNCRNVTDDINLNNATSLMLVAYHAFYGIPSVRFDVASNIYYDKSDKFCFGSYDDQAPPIGNINIKPATTNIAIKAFSSCASITSVSFNGCRNLINIGEYAFSYCSGITGTLDLSPCENLTKLWNYCFYESSSISSIVLPTAMQNIGSHSFGGTNITGTLDLSPYKSLTNIGDSAFYGCKKIDNLVFPTSIETVGSQAFYNCSGIKKVDFSRCTKFNNLGTHSFYNCLVDNITFGWTKSQILSEVPFQFVGDGNFPNINDSGVINIANGVTSAQFLSKFSKSPLSYKTHKYWNTVGPDAPTSGSFITPMVLLIILIAVFAVLIIGVIIMGGTLNSKLKRIDEDKKDKFPAPRGAGPRRGGPGGYNGPGRYSY